MLIKEFSLEKAEVFNDDGTRLLTVHTLVNWIKEGNPKRAGDFFAYDLNRCFSAVTTLDSLTINEVRMIIEKMGNV